MHQRVGTEGARVDLDRSGNVRGEFLAVTQRAAYHGRELALIARHGSQQGIDRIDRPLDGLPDRRFGWWPRAQPATETRKNAHPKISVVG